MNEENLKPHSFDKRTASERREIAKKAGRASGAARRQRKSIKEAILDAIYAETTEGTTVLDEMVAGMIRRVIKTGDPAALEKLMEYADKSPKRKREDEELKLKREAVGKAAERSDVEDLSILAELINGPDADDRVE